MGKLQPAQAGARAVDIQKSLQDVPISQPHYWFDRVILAGEVARIGANMRGFEVIDLDQLNVMATELGISPSKVKDTILPELENAKLVKIVKEQGKIRVQEDIPRSSKLVETVGKILLEKELEPIEASGLQALEMTSTQPLPKDDLLKSLSDIREDDFQVLLDCGRVGRFLEEYDSPKGERIVYSPLIWNQENNDPIKMFAELPESGRDELHRITREVAAYPGKPVGEISPANQLILSQAARSGFLQQTTVSTSDGSKNYLFIPGPKFRVQAEGLKQFDLFDRAKVVLSCVRQGQHYGKITKILYPDKLLGKLLDRGWLKPHSEIKEQYALLHEYGIAKVEKGDGGRSVLRLIRNDENEQIIQAAIDMVKSPHEAATARVMEPEVRELMVKGDFLNPSRNRVRASKSEIPGVSYKTIQKMLERLRGESVA